MTKITPDHLARSAFVYIRQSTTDQVLNNHESRRRQYGLAERARQLGWQDVVVIDDDLGRSGSGVTRPGFERLLAAICEGRAGAVFAIEASRLARNGRDWHTLIVIVQAGSSEDGKHLAAAHADLNFALVRTIEEGQRYRKDFDERLQRIGRQPSDLKVLPGILPIVAKSRDEAEEKRNFLETLVPARVGIDLVSSWCGIDLSAYPVDGPLPPLPDASTYDGQRTNLERLKAFAKENLTIREIARRISNAGTGPVMSGTPTEIADEMEAWHVAGAADGFNLMFPLLPDDWLQFAELVVPELQR